MCSFMLVRAETKRSALSRFPWRLLATIATDADGLEAEMVWAKRCYIKAETKPSNIVQQYRMLEDVVIMQYNVLWG